MAVLLLGLTGQMGHYMGDFPLERQGNEGNKVESSAETPSCRVAKRGTTSRTGGCSNHLYAITIHHDQEYSLDVFTGMLKVIFLDVYALLDLGATLSFMTLYIVVEFGIHLERLLDPFNVSYPVGEFILINSLYRLYSFNLSQRHYN